MISVRCFFVTTTKKISNVAFALCNNVSMCRVFAIWRDACIYIYLYKLYNALLITYHANVLCMNIDEPFHHCTVAMSITLLRRTLFCKWTSSYELYSFDPGTNTTRLIIRVVLHKQHTTDQKQNDFWILEESIVNHFINR